MANQLTTIKKLTFDKGFMKVKVKQEGKVYSCYCDDIRLFFIHWETGTYGKNKNGYWWIEEHYFKSTIFNKLGQEHPKNYEIGQYLRVPLKTKEEVINACEKLFHIYLSLFFESEYKLKPTDKFKKKTKKTK